MLGSLVIDKSQKTYKLDQSYHRWSEKKALIRLG